MSIDLGTSADCVESICSKTTITYNCPCHISLLAHSRLEPSHFFVLPSVCVHTPRVIGIVLQRDFDANCRVNKDDNIFGDHRHDEVEYPTAASAAEFAEGRSAGRISDLAV